MQEREASTARFGSAQERAFCLAERQSENVRFALIVLAAGSFVLASFRSVRAAPPTSLDLSADRVTYYSNRYIVTGEGHVRVRSVCQFNLSSMGSLSRRSRASTGMCGRQRVGDSGAVPLVGASRRQPKQSDAAARLVGRIRERDRRRIVLRSPREHRVYVGRPRYAADQIHAGESAPARGYALVPAARLFARATLDPATGSVVGLVLTKRRLPTDAAYREAGGRRAGILHGPGAPPAVPSSIGRPGVPAPSRCRVPDRRRGGSNALL